MLYAKRITHTTSVKSTPVASAAAGTAEYGPQSPHAHRPSGTGTLGPTTPSTVQARNPGLTPTQHLVNLLNRLQYCTEPPPEPRTVGLTQQTFDKVMVPRYTVSASATPSLRKRLVQRNFGIPKKFVVRQAPASPIELKKPIFAERKLERSESEHPLPDTPELVPVPPEASTHEPGTPEPDAPGSDTPAFDVHTLDERTPEAFGPDAAAPTKNALPEILHEPAPDQAGPHDLEPHEPQDSDSNTNVAHV